MYNFTGFPKIPRLFRDITITEKIDGTNGQIYIENINALEISVWEDIELLMDTPEQPVFKKNDMILAVGSRKRWITPRDDNYGFASWAWQHAEMLIEGLGTGHHFGEWWGQKVQRGYGMTEKVFSLFNTSLWSDPAVRPECCDVVPVLYQGPFYMKAVHAALDQLEHDGSTAAMKYGSVFMRPEGVVVFHTAGNLLFKATIEDDNLPKSLAPGKDDAPIMLLEGGC